MDTANRGSQWQQSTGHSSPAMERRKMDSLALMVKGKVSACFSLVPRHHLEAMCSSSFKLEIASDQVWSQLSRRWCPTRMSAVLIKFGPFNNYCVYREDLIFAFAFFSIKYNYQLTQKSYNCYLVRITKQSLVCAERLLAPSFTVQQQCSTSLLPTHYLV